MSPASYQRHLGAVSRRWKIWKPEIVEGATKKVFCFNIYKNSTCETELSEISAYFSTTQANKYLTNIDVFDNVTGSPDTEQHNAFEKYFILDVGTKVERLQLPSCAVAT